MAKYNFGRNVPPHERSAVFWYQPDVLLKAARELLSSLDMLRNRDLRESYVLPLTVTDLSKGRDDAFWFDFIADTGDGGNATYAVAHAALEDSMCDLSRGELLLFGGDLAYPGASPEEYRYRFIEMFEGAIPVTASGKVREQPFHIAALAQNHDWMDSAATFSRYFIRDKHSHQFLGAHVLQQQSYFCVKLPYGWWAIGLDFALTHDLDHDQYQAFAHLAKDGKIPTNSGVYDEHKIGKNDSVILIYPEPYWTRSIGDGADIGRPKRYQRLEGLLGERIKIRLAGDLHHYMRWTSDKSGQLITCGTGGAFTHPTHTKPSTDQIVARTIPSIDSIPSGNGEAALLVGHEDGNKKFPSDSFTRLEKSVYPPAEASKKRAINNWCALFEWKDTWATKNEPWWKFWKSWTGNRGFAVLIGVLYLFNAYLNSVPFIRSFNLDGFKPMEQFLPGEFFSALLLWLKAMLFSPLGLIINFIMVSVCITMGREIFKEMSSKISCWRRKGLVIIGLLHPALHIFFIFSLQFWIHQAVKIVPIIGQPSAGEPFVSIVYAVVVGIVMFFSGMYVGTLIFGGYLALISRFGYMTNNGYSALRIQDYKGFLRFKLAANGTLSGHFIAIDRVPRKWTTAGNDEQPVWEANDSEATAPRIHDSFTIPVNHDPTSGRDSN